MPPLPIARPKMSLAANGADASMLERVALQVVRILRGDELHA
jgi:hypothetical protein